MVESIWTSQTMSPAASTWGLDPLQGLGEHAIDGVAAEAGGDPFQGP
ncbi:hypothetical protein OG613_01950 [Streptomyces sp. NBC_00015]